MTRDELTRLVTAQQPGLYRYLRFLGADRAAAEDLCQDTFLEAVAPASPLLAGQVRNQPAWLRGVARNLLLERCRRARTNPVRVDSNSLAQAEDLWQREFLRDGDGSDYLEALRQCVQALPPDQRKLLDMQYAQDLSRADMSRQTGLTEDGVKSAMRRIRAKLAEGISRRLRLSEETHP